MTQVLKSIKGVRARFTRLDECGNPVVGSCTTVVTDGFISVTLAAEVEEGQEYLTKNANGDLCVSFTDAARFKWVNVSAEFCEVNPDILDIISGANPVISGGSTIGSTFGSEAQSNNYALEVWTKRVNPDSCAPGQEQWGYFLVPFVRNGRLDGDIVIQNDTLTVSAVGQGFGAPATWLNGPYLDNPFVEQFPAGDLFGMVVTPVQPPAVTNGCVAYATS